MATFRLTGPNGEKFELTAPDDATPDQVMQVARSQFEFKPNSAPAINAATANMDPRDLRETNVLTATGPEAVKQRFKLASQVGPVDRFVRGGEDAVIGLGQLAARAIPGQGAQNFMDDLQRQRQEEYRQGRLIRGENPYGVDVPRIAGQTTTAAAMLPLKPAPTWIGRMGQGALTGGVGGATAPIEDTSNFGAEKATQVGVGAATGAIATPAAEVLLRGASAAVNALRRLGRTVTAQDIDAALTAAGVRLADLAPEVQAAIRQQVGGQLKQGATLNADELRRFTDITAVGATPTRGAVSLDPVAVTQERNLAKVGANSSDPALQQLSQMEQANNAALIRRVNALGAGGAPPQAATGSRVINALRGADSAKQASVKGLYDRAEAINSAADQPITFDAVQFVERASKELEELGRDAFLPAEVRGLMNKMVERAKRGEPMTMPQFEQMRTILATAQRSARDGNARFAIGVVRDALEQAEPSNLAGEAARDAFGRARSAHASRMRSTEQSPAMQAALDDADPDQFVRKFIATPTASVADVAVLKRQITADPEAFDMVRRSIVDHLKEKALSGASDEAGNFSQSQFNRALKQIGDGKLGQFFSAAEIEQLKQVGRAAAYLQSQPKGSAVNNSNTAGMLVGALDRVLQAASSVPLLGPGAVGAVNALRTGARQVAQGRMAEQAMQPFAGPGENALLRLASPLGASIAADQRARRE